MTDQQDRAFVALQPLMDGSRATAVGVHAPIGAVSPDDRERYAATNLTRDGATLTLQTALPGTVMLQRRTPEGAWESITLQPPGRGGQTVLVLPPDAATYRVVFVPKNEDLNTWVSAELLA